MAKRLITIIAIFLLLLTVLPLAAFAAGQVTIDSIGTKNPGSSVTIKGTTELSEISVRVIRPDGTTLIVDVLSKAAFPTGTTFTLPADAATGTYTVVAGGSSPSATTTTTFQVASTTPGRYTLSLSANPSAGGSVTGAGTYSQNASVTVTAAPSAGYVFVNWTKGGQVVSTNATYTFTLLANTTLVANFKSTDATLRSLSVEDCQLNPAFKSSVTSYTVVLPAATVDPFEKVITATPTHSNATVGAASWPGTLAGKDRKAEITVTAESGATKKYTIFFTVPEEVTQPVATVDEPGAALAITSNTTQDTVINVDEAATNAVVTVETLLGTGAGVAANEAVTPAEITVNSKVTIGTTTRTVEVAIPKETKITGPTGWNGVITLPTVKETPSATITDVKAGSETVIEVGFGDEIISFSKPVKLLLPGQAGKKAGYVRGGAFTAIPEIPGLAGVADPDAAARVLGARENGYAAAGADMVIWTMHFTEFVAYETVAVGPGPGPSGPSGPVVPGVQITPAQGGTVKMHGATVLIPEHAFGETVNVNIVKVADIAALPLRDLLLSDVFDITLSKKLELKKPVTITLPFDKSKVDPDKQEVGLFWYNESQKKWVSLDDVSVDLEKGLASGSIDHFTKFAVLAVDLEAEEEAVVLTDIKGHWAETYILRLVEMGAISGYPDKTFKPDNKITRAEFATVIVKAFGLEAAAGKGKVFADTAGHWAESFISIAASRGVLSGYSDTAFGPDDEITREQMAAMIVNAARPTGAGAGSAFADNADIADWALRSVDAAVNAGIIKGYPDNTFKPQNSATRAEAVTVIINALD